MRHPLRDRPTAREILAGALVLAGLAAAVAAVYVVVVIGGGAILGQGDSPNLALSVVATGLVALGFERVQTWLRARADSLLPADRVSPFEVLRRFSGQAVAPGTPEETPVEMARLLAEGTGVEWAQVWFKSADGTATLAADWPPDGSDDTDPPDGPDRPGQRTLDVRLGDDLLGFLRVRERPGRPLSTVEERLFNGLAAQAGLVMHGVRLREQLAAQAHELTLRAAELRRSRERLVDAQDEERRRLERDIHDGAQQHLVALAVNLRLVETIAERAPERAAVQLADQADAALVAIETLLELSRGIYPRALTDGGLAPALEAAANSAGVPVDLRLGDLPRVSPAAEATVYFCVLEAIQNAAKHAHAHRVVVHVHLDGDRLAFEVTDDGDGIAPDAVAGAGLSNLRDRVDDAHGTLDITSTPGHGTVVQGSLPLGGEG